MSFAGRSLGRYRLDALLGRGGMAEVYRASDTKLGRTVAVKVILAAHAEDRLFRERFEREAQLVASLRHPSILPVYDYGDEDGLPYLVMPFLEGGTLRDRMVGEPVPFPLAADWVRQLGEALDAAHARGILHRDVKPANVLLDADDRLALADFGIARMLESVTGLTATGMVVGTPIYMAPEQAQGHPATPSTDLYALGVLAWELLSGRPPFAGESALALMHQHVTSPVPALSSQVQGLPAGLDSVFARILAKDPGERPPSGRALADLLLGYLPTGLRAVEERPTTPWAPALRPEAGVPRAEATPPQAQPSRTPAPRLPASVSITSEPTISTAPQPARRIPRAALAAGSLAVVAVAAVLLVRSRPAPPVAAGPGETPVAGPRSAAALPADGVGLATISVVEIAVPTSPATAVQAPARPDGRLEALQTRLSSALARRRLTPPDPENALETLASIRKEYPKSDVLPRSESLVVSALTSRADERRDQGDVEGARADLLQAQVLRPGDRGIEASLASLDAAGTVRKAKGAPADSAPAPVVAPPPPAPPALPRPNGTDTSADGGLRQARERLDPALQNGRRPTRADFEAARAAADEALRREPGSLAALALKEYASGGIAYVEGRDAEAAAALAIAARTGGRVGLWELKPLRSANLRRFGDRGQGRMTTGWALALAYGDARNEARGALDAELAGSPSDPALRLAHAVLQRMDRRSDEAIREAKALHDSNPPGMIRFAAAELAAEEELQRGHPEDAVRWFRKAAEPPSGLAGKAAYEAGRVLRDVLGRPEEAATLFQQACDAGNGRGCDERGGTTSRRGSKPPGHPRR